MTLTGRMDQRAGDARTLHSMTRGKEQFLEKVLKWGRYVISNREWIIDTKEELNLNFWLFFNATSVSMETWFQVTPPSHVYLPDLQLQWIPSRRCFLFIKSLLTIGEIISWIRLEVGFWKFSRRTKFWDPKLKLSDLVRLCRLPIIDFGRKLKSQGVRETKFWSQTQNATLTLIEDNLG